MTATREDIIRNNPLSEVVQHRGMALKKSGGEFYAPCPFHADGKKPNFRISIEKQTWFCDVCGFGGSVIDFVVRADNVTVGEAMARLSGEANGNGHASAAAVEVASYNYTDENGRLLYQVVRFVPKTFRQRHKSLGGEWVWNMEGVRRVLYHLQEVVKADQVFVVEGEKDADALRELGFVATCNVGGAKKWLDAYSEHLKGKSVVVWPDNDKTGLEHAEQVVKSVAKAKFVRQLSVPEKDAADFVKVHGASAKKDIEALVKATEPLNMSGAVPFKNFIEMEDAYREFVAKSEGRVFNLGNWLPSLGRLCRPLVSGELVAVIADTGVGKTAIASSLALAAWPLATLMFELELPEPLLFERFVQQEQGFTGKEIFESYKYGPPLAFRGVPKVGHILWNTQSRMTADELERCINISEVKLGQRPALVLVDYIGLMTSTSKNGSRYERVSEVAEQLKVVAKQTETVLVFTSQVARDKHRRDAEVSLHDAKDSGSIENSAGLVLGAWRSGDDGETMNVKILKNTRGQAGRCIECNFHGETMRITERSNAEEPT